MLPILFAQTKKIELLNARIEDQLRSKQLIEFYVRDRLENPGTPAIAGLLDTAKNLKSYAILAYGLKEFVDGILAQFYPGQNIQSVLLESKAELEGRPTDWLAEGDIITGFSGVTNDARGPRIITSAEDDGYLWRYLAEPDMDPKPANHDKFFQRRDWILCEVEGDLDGQLTAIAEIQDTEISGLTALWEALNNGEFQGI